MVSKLKTSQWTKTMTSGKIFFISLTRHQSWWCQLSLQSCNFSSRIKCSWTLSHSPPWQDSWPSGGEPNYLGPTTYMSSTSSPSLGDARGWSVGWVCLTWWSGSTGPSDWSMLWFWMRLLPTPWNSPSSTTSCWSTCLLPWSAAHTRWLGTCIYSATYLRSSRRKIGRLHKCSS